MTIRVVVGIDPGATTGIAWCGDLLMDERPALFVGTEVPAYEAVRWAWAMIDQYGPALALACEPYTITMATVRKSRQYDAIGVDYALRYRCHHAGAEYHCYTPATAKKFISDDLLRQIGAHVPTKGGHADDGTRQVLTYLWQRDHSALASAHEDKVPFHVEHIG